MGDRRMESRKRNRERHYQNRDRKDDSLLDMEQKWDNPPKSKDLGVHHNIMHGDNQHDLESHMPGEIHPFQ